MGKTTESKATNSKDTESKQTVSDADLEVAMSALEAEKQEFLELKAMVQDKFAELETQQNLLQKKQVALNKALASLQVKIPTDEKVEDYPAYLKNTDNGRIYPFTLTLFKKPNFTAATAEEVKALSKK